ncbi:MAG: CHAP domain-containing protein [Acidimicrobiales bacterium]
MTELSDLIVLKGRAPMLETGTMRARTGGRWAVSTQMKAASAISLAIATVGALIGLPGVALASGRARAAGGGGPPAGHVSVSPRLRSEEHAGTYRDGGVLAYGSARFFGSPTALRLASPIAGMAATADGNGYWLVGADGGVLTYGDARYFGGVGRLHLSAPVVAMAAVPDGRGYWLVTAGGRVYAFGDAHNFGWPAAKVPDPIVGFAATPDGGGYWMVTSHGAVYSFGDARYDGSLGTTNLHNIPVVAIASSVDGKGYWLVQGGGEVIAYGDAPRVGQLGRGYPPVSGIAVTPDGQGYWLMCGNGEVEAFGDAPSFGGNSQADPRPPISGIATDPAGDGYWLLDSEAFHLSLTRPGSGGRRRIVEIAASQLGPSPDGGHFCNPYGPCEEWCALFATWVWQRVGVPVPRYAFVGDVYDWAVRHTRVVPARQKPAPGDLVLYGTGPESVRASPHIGVVAQVWPDGEIDTIEGDAGPGRGGWTAVLVNGPYLPSQSFFANGMPIYGFAVP